MLCYSVRVTEPSTPHPLLADVGRVVQRVFTPVPDREGHALPTSEEALLAVEESLGQARQRWEEEPDLRVGTPEEQAQVLMQLEQLGETCRQARQVGFAGKLSVIFGAALAVVVLLFIGQRSNDVPVMAAAVIWTLSVPLYLRTAVAPRWQVYQRILSGPKSIDDRFLEAVSARSLLFGPPALLLRTLVYGLLAPPLVLVEARRSKKHHLFWVMLTLTAGFIWWGWTWADWQPPVELAP